MSKRMFMEYADSFLAMMRDERGASEHTLRAYAREVRGFAEFLTETLGEEGAMKVGGAYAYSGVYGVAVG